MQCVCSVHEYGCPFVQISWWMQRGDDQTGSAPEVALWSHKDYGGYGAIVHRRAASSKAHLHHAPLTHTTLIAFASFITFIASPLHCLLPGLEERSLWCRCHAHSLLPDTALDGCGAGELSDTTERWLPAHKWLLDVHHSEISGASCAGGLISGDIGSHFNCLYEDSDQDSKEF